MNEHGQHTGQVTRREWLQTSATLGATLGAAIISPSCATGTSGPAAASTSTSNKIYDVVIVGGGPGGLSGALTLGRARKRVLLCDSGPWRNAGAHQINNFVTRDGTPPEEFRRIGRQQLAAYPNVELRDIRVESISGTRGAFQVALSSGTIEARRVLICTGMIDEMLPIEGFRQLWGHTIFPCPHCDGWEVQDRRWGYLAGAAEAQMLLPFALQARSWTSDLTVFTDGTFEVPQETQEKLKAAGVRLERGPVTRLVGRENRLEAVELSDLSVPCEVLFAHPPQRQVKIVQELGLVLDEHGYVQVDEMMRATSIPGIYAAGDLTSRMQGAIWAAASAAQTAAMINVELSMELAVRGEL